MIHKNWIPIEQFDKDKYRNKQMVFGDFTSGKPPWLESGEWDGYDFYNYDVCFEPTHYLNPAVYRNESQ